MAVGRRSFFNEMGNPSGSESPRPYRRGLPPSALSSSGKSAVLALDTVALVGFWGSYFQEMELPRWFERVDPELDRPYVYFVNAVVAGLFTVTTKPRFAESLETLEVGEGPLGLASGSLVMAYATGKPANRKPLRKQLAQIPRAFVFQWMGGHVYRNQIKWKFASETQAGWAIPWRDPTRH